MSLPTINDIQAVDPVLSNMLVAYMQADERFVASKVFPLVPVEKNSGTYYILTKKYWMSDTMAPRAPGQDYPKSGYGVSTTTYAARQWALRKDIADEERANSQLPMDLETITVRWLAEKNLIRKERSFAADFMIASVWATDDDNSTTDWDDFSLGDPVTDVRTARRTISISTGQQANTIICGEIVADALENHPDILDRIKYTQAALADNVKAAMSGALGLANYWPALASYNSANEGQSGTFAAIIDDDALVCFVDPAAGVFGATAGKTFTWLPGGGEGLILRHRDEDVDGDAVKMKAQWDQKVVATDLGYLFLDVV